MREIRRRLKKCGGECGNRPGRTCQPSGLETNVMPSKLECIGCAVHTVQYAPKYVQEVMTKAIKEALLIVQKEEDVRRKEKSALAKAPMFVIRFKFPPTTTLCLT